MPTLHLLAKGRVQGVSYRVSAKEEADRLGLTGWVRNTPEGHVEITATGNDAALHAFTTWCRRGPAHAHVTDLITENLPETPFPNFSIRRMD
jgi:acylphosphatase